MDDRLKDIVEKSESIVFFGGAGVSTSEEPVFLRKVTYLISDLKKGYTVQESSTDIRLKKFYLIHFS